MKKPKRPKAARPRAPAVAPNAPKRGRWSDPATLAIWAGLALKVVEWLTN